jgi:sec-independent protein translocase protein TatB
MFDVSLVELAVIALVALLVLGPERLPRAARTVGFYVRKARQSWYSVKSEIERELAADELKRSLKQTEETVRRAVGEGEAAVKSVASSVGVMEPAQSIAPPAAQAPLAPGAEEPPPPRSEHAP